MHSSISRRARFAFVLTMGFGVVAPLALAAEPVAIFNGASLAGWEGEGTHWRVENGAIVGEIPAGTSLDHNTWLVWRGGELGDFEFNARVKLTGEPGANSGIQFRCQIDTVNHVSGYQADLDMGAVWLGRIYDEHGRALLLERGSRVDIAADGSRQVQVFAPAEQYAVLFRPNDWNDYRILAIGDRMSVFVNGTLFADLRDRQPGEQDLSGGLAFQLHSGPATRVEFKDITVEHLAADDSRLGEFPELEAIAASAEAPGIVPIGPDGGPLNLGFEEGSLAGWTATGDAFREQPVRQDGISSRWQGQTSNKEGDWFIGGYEIANDTGLGTLTSPTFAVTHPYLSFRLNGGSTPATRAEVFIPATGNDPENVLFTAVGDQREQMKLMVADLRRWQGATIAVRIVDESQGGWGHLNFDDIRWHETPPIAIEPESAWRSTRNPVLQHLVANSVAVDESQPASATTAAMFVPEGFSVDVIAAEPDLHQPMAFTFDARGRLWVVEGHCYPQKRPEGEGIDRILIFADEDGDGTFESRKVFCEGLNLVSGMEVGHGGVWVGAAPELLFIADRDGDDIPDGPPEVLLNGFGYGDTHETLNNFQWGPDGWLYGNQGVFNRSEIGAPGDLAEQRRTMQAGVWRYHPVKKMFEVFAHGGSNQWGLDYDDHGQFFMTHCRSFWGEGGTTHVIQGGHYWNQVNGGYAPFISATPLPDRPWLRNYLLASARYDSGEGGAGRPGTGAVYGGHSHVGTMIYLGDNWPAEYRNHLFTHNLHGHQINHQINRREGGGYNTVHAGSDVFFCADQQYIGVDLQCGPDGAVYISDWYDPRHCHNPDIEQWDRGNGRMYRMKYDAAYQPVRVDLTQMTDDELVALQLHANDWYVRTSRLVLAERAAILGIAPSAVKQLREMAASHADPSRRLRALWTLHSTLEFTTETMRTALDDPNEYVRAWGVQLGVEALLASDYEELLVKLVAEEESLFVRRYLASAIQQVPHELGWTIAERLSAQPDNASDRELPKLLWYGIAEMFPYDMNRGLALADNTTIPALCDNIEWHAARSDSAARANLIARLPSADAAEQWRLLSLVELALRGMRGLDQPESWSQVAASLYSSQDARTREAAESIGAAFGDETLFARMRARLDDPTSNDGTKRHALGILSGDGSRENVGRFIALLDSPGLVREVLPLLARQSDAAVPDALIARLLAWDEATANAALDVLSSRVPWSVAVLDAIAGESLPKEKLSAYHARRMAALGDAALNERLEREWGRLGQSSEERQAEIAALVAAYQQAPLWAYNDGAGAAHFKKLCATCHQPENPSQTFAPRLAGTGAKGVGYIVENILDPSAVVGRDYQARLIITSDGQVLSGLIESETDSAITLKTLTASVVIPRDEIEATRLSDDSFMPVDLLKPLSERERIELLKYLMAQ
jgi:putative membrane-bound dehydrogenase-like protein